MRSSFFPNQRHWIWPVLGTALGLTVISATIHYMGRAPSPVLPDHTRSPFGKGNRGTLGSITEQSPAGRLVLRYQSIQGEAEDLRLGGVDAVHEEPETHWFLKAPHAERTKTLWTLMGPVDLEARDPQGKPLGQGQVMGRGPALRWQNGHWEGLAPLTWRELRDEGRGVWTMPAGWKRSANGFLRVDKGPVRWETEGQDNLKTLEAEQLQAEANFIRASMKEVRAVLKDGEVQAQGAELDPQQLKWRGPLYFQRSDGWEGEALDGFAPRPMPGERLERIELNQIEALKLTPTGTERLEAKGARWTPAGLRLEGSVRWEQPHEGLPVQLTAPRILMREGAGDDLPEDLPKGHVWAEGQALLSWGKRQLSAPRIKADRIKSTWKLESPVYGKTEEGTFQTGAGQGNLRRWSFEGPIQMNFHFGGNLRGSTLLMEEQSWTLTGRPAAWNRLRERLEGPRLIRKGEQLNFPEGLTGVLAIDDGDVFMKADWGISEPNQISLGGQVEFRGQGWRLRAESVTALLGPGRKIIRLLAKGHKAPVSLRSRSGEAFGEALEWNPNTQSAQWKGRVRGRGEGATW